VTGHIINWIDNKIVVSLPWGCKPGMYKVKVTTASASVSNTKPFKFTKPIPKISNLPSQSEKVGSQIGINGKNFGEKDMNSQVLFDNNKADVINWSNDSITVTLPSIGTKIPKKGKVVSIKVKTIYGTSNSKKFKVLQ